MAPQLVCFCLLANNKVRPSPLASCTLCAHLIETLNVQWRGVFLRSFIRTLISWPGLLMRVSQNPPTLAQVRATASVSRHAHTLTMLFPKKTWSLRRHGHDLRFLLGRERLSGFHSTAATIVVVHWLASEHACTSISAHSHFYFWGSNLPGQLHTVFCVWCFRVFSRWFDHVCFRYLILMKLCRFHSDEALQICLSAVIFAGLGDPGNRFFGTV